MRTTLRPRNRTTLGLVLASLALPALAPPSAVAASAGTPVAPAQLAPVLAQMRALTLSSERFDASVTLHGHRLPKPLAALRALTVRVTGEANLGRPESGTVTSTLLGSSVTTRVIGDTIYTDVPKLAAKDGGRPWVEETAKVEPDLTGTAPGVAPAGSAAPFAKFAATLAAAHSVTALGPVTVNGVAASGYRFAIPPSALDSKIGKKLKAKLKRLHLKESAVIDTDIAANGLPAHTEGVLAIGRLRLAFTTDILAVNFPLAVAPPPAEETITLHELLALLAAQSKHHHP